MWVSLSFTATAFVSGTWVIMPHGRDGGWIVEALMAASAGSLGVLFIYLGASLSRHRMRKLRWRELEKTKKNETVADAAMKGKIRSHCSTFDSSRSENQMSELSQSTNSDVDSSTSLGYHAY